MEGGSMESVVMSLPPLIVKDLLSLGVCLRCIFRVLHTPRVVYSTISISRLLVFELLQSVNGFDSNKGTDGSEVSANNNDSILAPETSLFKRFMSNPCSVCLGILQEIDDDDEHVAVDNVSRGPTFLSIQKAVQSGGYLFDSFSLEVTVPGVVFIRERALWQYLQQKYTSESLFKGDFANEKIFPLKDVLKWSMTEPLERMLLAKSHSDSLFRIVLLYRHAETFAELEFINSATGGSFKRKQNGSNGKGQNSGYSVADASKQSDYDNISLAAIQRALVSMSPGEFQEHYPCPPVKPNTNCEITATCYRSPIYIGGRYLKLSRNVSQSPWMIEEERKVDGSVQEIIAEMVVPHFKAESYKFHAAGREDIDVRMLGNGRPFILEILDARILHSHKDILGFEYTINNLKTGWVKVRGLKEVGKDAWNVMLQGESEKQKQYTAVVWVSRPVTKVDLMSLSKMKELEIQQKTPIRVLHRRSPLVRARTIHWMQSEEIVGSDHYFLLHLCTQAGTYIKEFVHSDLGRTYPNINSLLGCQSEILQLDVTDIKMDFFD